MSMWKNINDITEFEVFERKTEIISKFIVFTIESNYYHSTHNTMYCLSYELI